MMLIDKDGERIYCGVQMGLLTKDTIRRLNPDALSLTREEYIQLAYDSAFKRNPAGSKTFLAKIKEYAAFQWDEAQQLYAEAKD